MAEAKRRGPRLDPTVEPRVIEAVLDELATVGRDHLSMDGIANRAGVSKATVYTRWRSKDELLLAAYQHLSRPFPQLDSGSLTADLDALCDTVLAGAADHRYAAVLTEFVAAAATDPSLRPHLHAVSDAWQAGIQGMLRAAQERGELGDDIAVALLAEALSALTLTRVMFQRPPLDDTLRDDLHTIVRHPPRRS
jgi:AcrR family transcriptional regulator